LPTNPFNSKEFIATDFNNGYICRLFIGPDFKWFVLNPLKDGRRLGINISALHILNAKLNPSVLFNEYIELNSFNAIRDLANKNSALSVTPCKS
jgi:hypothetical protein